MKILHAHATLRTGGIESMILMLANEMSKRHSVTFLSIFEPQESHSGLRKLDKSINVITTHKMKNGFEISVLFRIYRAMKEGRYDVVNIHAMFYYYIIAILLLHRRTKFFYTIHSEASKEDFGWDKKVYWVRKKFLQWGWIHAITISQHSDQSFYEYYGLHGHMIYNGTRAAQPDNFDIEQYRLTKETKVFVHVGRICEPKNQEVLCRVFDRLIKEGHDIVLLIVGPNRVKFFFDKIQPYFSDRIVYLGERDNVVDIMNVADGFCLPSIWEGMPVTLLEAMSVGCIPICTPVGGVPEVVRNGETGFLSRSVSVDDYYQSMRMLLTTEEKEVLSIKSRWRSLFAQFEISHIARLYESFYEEIIND